MNSYKTLVDRNVVTSRHFVPSEQPSQEAALFSLCGVQTVVTNHWSTKPEEQLEIFEKFMKGVLSDGLYLGASLPRHYSNYDMEMDALEEDDPLKVAYRQKTKPLFRLNTVTYGVPLVRVV